MEEYKTYIERKRAEVKSTGDRILVHAGKKERYERNRSAMGATDISQCIKLLGQEVTIESSAYNLAERKKATIIMLYPHMALAVYRGGFNDEYEFRVGLSIADLVEQGLLSFMSGKPEVVK